MTYGPKDIVREQLEASVEELNRSSQSQNGCAPKSATSGSEPSAAFTPGPWELSEAVGVGDAGEPEYLVVGGEGQSFGLIGTNLVQADARLHAAAPDLLAALLAIFDGVEDEARADDGVDGVVLLPLFESEIRKARSAIAKALHPSAADSCGVKQDV